MGVTSNDWKDEHCDACIFSFENTQAISILLILTLRRQRAGLKVPIDAQRVRARVADIPKWPPNT